jgi:hypothetical protein
MAACLCHQYGGIITLNFLSQFNKYSKFIDYLQHSGFDDYNIDVSFYLAAYEGKSKFIQYYPFKNHIYPDLTFECMIINDYPFWVRLDHHIYRSDPSVNSLLRLFAPNDGSDPVKNNWITKNVIDSYLPLLNLFNNDLTIALIYSLWIHHCIYHRYETEFAYILIDCIVTNEIHIDKVEFLTLLMNVALTFGAYNIATRFNKLTHIECTNKVNIPYEDYLLLTFYELPMLNLIQLLQCGYLIHQEDILRKYIDIWIENKFVLALKTMLKRNNTQDFLQQHLQSYKTPEKIMFEIMKIIAID